MPGKGLPARLADAMAARTADRVRLLQAAVDGRIAPFSSSLESGLAASCVPFRPVEGAAMTFAVLVTWVDEVPRILAGIKDAPLPAFVASGTEARASALLHVGSIFSAASPSTAVPVGFLSTISSGAESSPCLSQTITRRNCRSATSRGAPSATSAIRRCASSRSAR